VDLAGDRRHAVDPRTPATDAATSSGRPADTVERTTSRSATLDNRIAVSSCAAPANVEPSPRTNAAVATSRRGDERARQPRDHVRIGRRPRLRIA
jgi:hypothetical protein